MFKNTAIIITLLAAVFSFGAAARAQDTEAAASLNLTSTALPANALRALPGSVPAEIDRTLDQLVAEGGGKLERGATEVVIWAGGGYKKASAPQIARELQANWKSAGWIFELGGEKDGVAIFTLLKDGAARRALVGFYGADAEAFVLALTELHQTGGAAAQNEETPARADADAEAPNAGGSLASLAGKWERKQSGMSSYSNGSYLGSSGNYESYTFFADGRVEYSSLIAVQNYGCRMEVFSSRKGRAAVAGGALTVNLTSGSLTRDDSCSKSKNYTKPMEPSSTSYRWKIERDSSGALQLALTEGNGETFYYQRAKE